MKNVSDISRSTVIVVSAFKKNVSTLNVLSSGGGWSKRAWNPELVGNFV